MIDYVELFGTLNESKSPVAYLFESDSIIENGYSFEKDGDKYVAECDTSKLNTLAMDAFNTYISNEYKEPKKLDMESSVNAETNKVTLECDNSTESLAYAIKELMQYYQDTLNSTNEVSVQESYKNYKRVFHN